MMNATDKKTIIKDAIKLYGWLEGNLIVEEDAEIYTSAENDGHWVQAQVWVPRRRGWSSE